MQVEEILSDLIRFRTEAPPGNEEVCARYVEDYINGLHLDSCECRMHNFEPKRANLVARIGPSDTPGLLLSGHIDTVPAGDTNLWDSDPFEPTVKDGKMFGRGAADMKSGLAAMLKSLELAKMLKLKRGLVLTATAWEEIKLDGLKKLLKSGGLNKNDARFGVVGEPTNLEAVRAHKGGTLFEVRLHGRSAHASRPELGVNAIDYASQFVVELEAVKEELARVRHPDLGPTVLAVTLIQGGIRMNIIPDRCELTIDCRRIPQHTAGDIYAIIRKILAELSDVNRGLTTDVKMTFEGDPLGLPENHEFVRLVERTLGVKSTIAPYGSEAPLYVQIGIPTLVLGPGRIEEAHTPNEFVGLDQLKKAATMYGQLIQQVCN